MSEYDPVESAAKGITKGALEWTKDEIGQKVKDLITKFRNKDIAFVEDVETIKIAKEQLSTSEWMLFSSYVKDKKLRILFRLGLTLRRLEETGKPFDDLKIKIIKKYDVEGFHIAQCVQSGIFSKYIGNVLERATTPEKLKFEMENLFKSIENTVVFIQTTDKEKERTAEIIAKLRANSPKMFIISSMGEATMKKCESIADNIMKTVSNYNFELYQTGKRKIFFLNKKD